MNVDNLVFAGDQNDFPRHSEPILDIITNTDTRFTALFSNQWIDMEIFATLRQMSDEEGDGQIRESPWFYFEKKRLVGWDIVQKVLHGSRYTIDQLISGIVVPKQNKWLSRFFPSVKMERLPRTWMATLQCETWSMSWVDWWLLAQWSYRKICQPCRGDCFHQSKSPCSS